MSDTTVVEVYENYLGALVVNDCPVCDNSHFIQPTDENFTPSETGGEYVCNDEDIEVHK